MVICFITLLEPRGRKLPRYWKKKLMFLLKSPNQNGKVLWLFLRFGPNHFQLSKLERQIFMPSSVVHSRKSLSQPHIRLRNFCIFLFSSRNLTQISVNSSIFYCVVLSLYSSIYHRKQDLLWRPNYHYYYLMIM